MSPETKELIRRCRNHVMTDEERWRQRVSFAYGNINISRAERGLPPIPREEVERTALADREASD